MVKIEFMLKGLQLTYISIPESRDMFFILFFLTAHDEIIIDSYA